MKKFQITFAIAAFLFISCRKETLPIVETLSVTKIVATQYILNGEVINDGRSTVTDRGFFWALIPNPSINDNVIKCGVGSGKFSDTISLEPSKTYYVKSYAVNSNGSSCGSEIIFTTPGRTIVVLDRDSRTDGWNCSYRYPYIDLLQLQESPTIYKTSDGGLAITDLLIRAEEFVDPKFSETARLNIVVVWIGYNDIAVNDQTVDFTFNNLLNYCTQRKAKGWKVIVCTEVSMHGKGSYGVCDQLRTQFNDLIRSRQSEFADEVADLGSNPLIGSTGAYRDTTYFCDGCHLTNAGTTIVAGIINQAINNVIAR